MVFATHLNPPLAPASIPSAVDPHTVERAWFLASGGARHFYSVHPRMSDDIDQRGIDLLTPVWHILDLTRQGRDDWIASLSY